MGKLVASWFTYNWKVKAFALFSALILWLFVNQSITTSKTLIGVPIRIVNLPEGKAVEGMQANGFLNRGINLTVTGTKDFIEKLEPRDLEIELDAAEAPDEWVVHVNKSNLVSLNPETDISRDISQVSHPELMLDLDKLSTAKVSVRIRRPNGRPPKGYEYLGVWPKYLFHNISGPKAIVQQLHSKGLEMSFDLSEISKEDLDALQTSQTGFYSDEVSFKVPDVWKKVNIPLLNRPLQTINDPNADQLRIDFLRKEYIMLNRKIPIRVYYPLKSIDTINPGTHPLKKSPIIQTDNGIDVLTIPLMAYNVSRLFVDIVKDHIEIVVSADPDPETGQLPWSVEFIDPQLLEDRFVSFLFSRHNLSTAQNEDLVRNREEQWRYRFRNFMHQMTVYTSPNQKLVLNSTLGKDEVSVEQRDLEKH